MLRKMLFKPAFISGIARGGSHASLGSGAGQAFTLVELLVVIAIIAVLAALAFPALSSMLEKGRRAECVSRLKQVGVGLLQYYADRPNEPFLYSGTYGNTNAAQPVWPYILANAGYVGKAQPVPQKIWNCPCATPTLTSYGVSQQNGSDYGVFGTIAHTSLYRMINILKPAKTWLVGDTQANSDPKSGWYCVWPRQSMWTNNHAPAVDRHGGRANVCMFDGHIEFLTHAQIAEGQYHRVVK